eukprot:2586648-Amphidinium_carterae.1
MTLSLLITMFQQLGALAVVSIAWPGPMNAVFQMLSVLAFDLEALKVNCVVQPRPAFSFAMRVLALLESMDQYRACRFSML